MKKQEKLKRRPAPAKEIGNAMKKTLAPYLADSTELRRRAEARLKDKKQAQTGKGAAPLSADENQRLLQELQIHQIELEMQNEELCRIQEGLEASQARYFDLYDLAPVGYLTLSKNGLILEINLAAATLLGAARGALIRKPITRFILPEDQDIYHEHCKLSFETGSSHVCEVRMVRVDAVPRWIRIDTIATEDADGAPVCRSTMIDITDRKQSEKALRESEEKYRTLFENAAEAIFIVQDGKVAFFNPTTTIVTGYAKEEFLSRSFTDFIHADDRDMVVDRYVRRFRGEDVPRRYPFRVLHKNGGFRWVELDTVLIDWKGRPATLNFLSDITERKQAEEALHQINENYRLLFENAGEGILIAQGDVIKFANPALEKILGYPKDVITSKPFVSFIHPDDRAILVDRHMRRMSGEPVETGYRFRSIAPDGAQRWLHIVSRLTSWNGTPASLSFVMDITEHKRAEDELRASEEKYRELVRYAPAGIYEIDHATNRFISVNDVICEYTGYLRDELFTMNLFNLLTKESQQLMLERLEKLMAGEKLEPTVEYCFRNKDGNERWTLLNAQYIYEAGKLKSSTGVIYDITERKEAEDKIKKQTDAMEAAIEGMAILNKNNDYTYMNQAHARIYGYENAGELIGKSWRTLYDADELKRFDAEIMPEFGQKGYWQGESLGMKKDGSKFPQEISLTALDGGGLICVVRDITLRKQAEDSLRQAEENYRSIFENAQEGIYRTTPEGKFLMANQAMARILGYDSPEELLAGASDITHQIYVHPEERAKTLELLERQGFVNDTEVQLYRKDGRIIWIYRTIRAVRDKQGKLLCLEGLVTDITDRKNSVDQLRKALGGTVQAIASVVETKDPYTAGHQRRVADLARTIAGEMGLSKKQTEGLRVAGIIHDIGKVSIPAEILSMPRKLANLEFSLIKTHVQAGYDILKDIDFPWPIARMVLEHHERINGSGYPNGLTRDQILIESRILAVADVVEAMATHRPYRPSLGLNSALAEIENNKGVLYDTDVVDACLRLFREKGFQLEGTPL